MPRANSFAAVKLVFLNPVSMKLTAFSEGLRKDFSIHTLPPAINIIGNFQQNR